MRTLLIVAVLCLFGCNTARFGTATQYRDLRYKVSADSTQLRYKYYGIDWQERSFPSPDSLAVFVDDLIVRD